MNPQKLLYLTMFRPIVGKPVTSFIDGTWKLVGLYSSQNPFILNELLEVRRFGVNTGLWLVNFRPGAVQTRLDDDGVVDLERAVAMSRAQKRRGWCGRCRQEAGLLQIRVHLAIWASLPRGPIFLSRLMLPRFTPWPSPTLDKSLLGSSVSF